MVRENQIHDLHPPISPSGLYWMVSVPRNGLTISPDGNTFTLEMQDVPVVDQPSWPAVNATATPARMSFKMVWKSTGETVKYEDPSKHSASLVTVLPARWRRKSKCLRLDSRGSPTR